MSKVGSVYTAASAGIIATSNSGDLVISGYDELILSINCTAVSGTNPTLTFVWQEKDDNGIYYTVYAPTAISAAGVIRRTIGPGCDTAVSIGATGRLTWTIGGTATPTVTCSISIMGKIRS